MTKQIILKKVRGYINPADLLTKVISGKDKVDQLVVLYGFVFWGGVGQHPCQHSEGKVKFRKRLM